MLDATISFHDELPGPGKCIRYDIRISRFFTLGATHLFQFEFDATVDGRPLLTMRNGSAGFFSAAELAAGQGIVDPKLARATADTPTNDHSAWFAPPLRTRERYSDAQLDALRNGDEIETPATAAPGCYIDADPAKDRLFQDLPGGQMISSAIRLLLHQDLHS